MPSCKKDQRIESICYEGNSNGNRLEIQMRRDSCEMMIVMQDLVLKYAAENLAEMIYGIARAN